MAAFNGTISKKEVTYQPLDDGGVFATVTFTDNQGATLDAWRGGHYLSDDELMLFATGKREILDKRFSDYAIELLAKSAQAAPKPQGSSTKIEVTPAVEAKAAEQEAAIAAVQDIP